MLQATGHKRSEQNRRFMVGWGAVGTTRAIIVPASHWAISNNLLWLKHLIIMCHFVVIQSLTLFTLASPPPVMSSHVTSCRQTASSVQFTAAVVLSLSHWVVNTQQLTTLPARCGNISLLNPVHFPPQRRFPSDNSDSHLTMTRRWSSECPGGSGWVCYSEMCLQLAHIAVIITHVSVAIWRR